jgi:hypothetical protein
MSEQHKLTAEERVRDELDYAVGPLEDRMVNGWLVALLMEEHAAQEVAEVMKERDEARAEVERLREAATELLEVADLRGDSDLPHPADDPIDWTARMQDAWDDLRTALKAADGGEVQQ